MTKDQVRKMVQRLDAFEKVNEGLFVTQFPNVNQKEPTLTEVGSLGKEERL